jgi:hypothetical protein
MRMPIQFNFQFKKTYMKILRSQNQTWQTTQYKRYQKINLQHWIKIVDIKSKMKAKINSFRQRAIYLFILRLFRIKFEKKPSL